MGRGRDPALATRVLRIFIDSIERSLRVCCAAPPSARPGALSFLQRFGSALNEHWHYHCCVSDGVFDTADDGSLRFVFASIDAQSAAQVQARVRRRVLAAYSRRGWLDAVSAANMAECAHPRSLGRAEPGTANGADPRPAWCWRDLGRYARLRRPAARRALVNPDRPIRRDLAVTPMPALGREMAKPYASGQCEDFVWWLPLSPGQLSRQRARCGSTVPGS